MQNSWEKVKINPNLKPSNQTKILYAGGDEIVNGHSKSRGGSYNAAKLQNSWERVKIQPILKRSSRTEISYAGGDEIVNGPFKV